MAILWWTTTLSKGIAHAFPSIMLFLFMILSLIMYELSFPHPKASSSPPQNVISVYGDDPILIYILATFSIVIIQYIQI